MSTITITITTQPFDFGTVNLGSILLQLEYDGITADINEELSFTAGYRKFEVVEFVSSPQSHNDQAAKYVVAFNRDYPQVGSPPPTGLPQANNLSATVIGNVVTITAKRGIFKNASYSGNALQSVTFNIDNSVQEVAKTFAFTIEGTGDCTFIRYTAQAATGGTGPYRLELNGNDFVTGWDGNADVNFDLQRGKAFSGYLYDSLDEVIETVSIVPPRKLVEGDFKVETVPNIGSSDVLVSIVTTVANTGPLEYALEDSQGDLTPYQSGTTFGGQTPGLYTLHVRDTYGCDITKQFEVFEFVDPNGAERVRYFSISDFNSLSFSENVDFGFDTRKNYDNVLSGEEDVKLPYSAGFCFPSTTRLRTQFKSSYDIHVCTLLKSDGTKQSLPLTQTQQNIGTIEKVDCKLFSSNGRIGVYFDGGNEYSPGTTTVIGSSPYPSGLPLWAQEEGNFVSLDTYGLKEVINTDLYDETRDVIYFEVDGTISADEDGKIQVTFNRHPYNLYRMDFDASLIDDNAKVIIEAGWAFDQIERRFHSEPIYILDNPKDFLKITWNSGVNFDDMVFTDGIGNDEGCQMWVKGRIRPIGVGESNTKDADERARSLKQRHSMRQALDIPLVSAKQWHKLGLAAGIADDGEFYIEDMLLVATEPIEPEPLDGTNLYSVVGEFAMFGERLAVKQDEIVTDPSTGLPGTAQTGKEPPNDPTLVRLRLEDGSWLLTDSGQYVALG